jgi:plasmid stabilization system protein ParE
VRELRRKIDALNLFPHRNSRAPEYPDGAADVRRLLHSPYRVLYQIIEPEADEAEGVVRILHIWHGARRPSGQPADED